MEETTGHFGYRRVYLAHEAGSRLLQEAPPPPLRVPNRDNIGGFGDKFIAKSICVMSRELRISSDPKFVIWKFPFRMGLRRKQYHLNARRNPRHDVKRDF